MLRSLALVGVLAACGTDAGVAPEATLAPRVRLVTDTQYTNAVRDLLGIASPEIHSPGTRPHQFIHDDNVLAVDAPLLVQYRIAAEAIAREAGTRCGDRACAEDFASRAFRRPLAAVERERLGKLYDDGGFALVVEAVLQAPSFVYRTELGIGGQLTPYELASELSFLFLDSIPDEPLWQAARDGTIADPAVVAAHVERLLASPRVQAHLTEVVLAWLDLHDIETIGRIGLTEPTRASMFEQTKLFVHDVLWRRGGGLGELLTSRETFVDAQLASYYGDVPTSWVMQPHTAAPERAGLLTHPGVLSMLSYGHAESIIHRGLYVQRKFLCAEDLGRPPFAAINATANITRGFNETQLAHFRSAHIYCANCHKAIDPPGFALHHFDQLGRWRETDSIGLPIEDDVVLAIDGEAKRFRGAAALGETLANSDRVAHCVVDQLAHHSLGRAVEDPAMRRYLQISFERADRDLVEVFRAIATSPMFRRRR
ncbi:MAG: DUF1592 domain-containing protein [Myxococcota bacterium]|nr:DUF1592 domain-containing protein [Myxococcota bacterium]